MKSWWFRVVTTLVFTSAIAFAQQGDKSSSHKLNFEDGVIKEGVYSNECFGFSFPIPAGWEIRYSVAVGKARHVTRGLQLFLLNQGTGKELGNSIALQAANAEGKNETAQDFVFSRLQAAMSGSLGGREVIEDAFPVDYAGKLFFRAEYKQVLGTAGTLYQAFIYTKFRGYFIGEGISAGSPQNLDQAAESLRGISFREDQTNPNCVLASEGAPEVAGTGGDIGESGSGMPAGNTDRSGMTAKPERIRVSQGVSTGLLVTRMAPQYPEDARQARIQGSVVLQALIDKDGNVADLTLVSGHPMLAPAAIEAVKQWKYKPYLLNGQPVKVETQIVVNFYLSGG